MLSFSCADLVFSASRTAATSVRLANSYCVVHSVVDNYIVQFTVPVTVFTGSIGIGQGYTWMSTADSTVTKDIHGNSLAVVLQSAAVEVGPQVVRFGADMNTGTVMLTLPSTLYPDTSLPGFTVSSIGFYTIALASALDSAVLLYTSQSFYLRDDVDTALTILGPARPPSNGSVIQLQLSNGNLNLMKLLDVGPDRLFLIIKSTLKIIDINGHLQVAAKTYPFKDPTVPSEFNALGQMMVSRFGSDTGNPDLQSGQGTIYIGYCTDEQS